MKSQQSCVASSALRVLIAVAILTAISTSLAQESNGKSAGGSDCKLNDHCYPIAKITTVSGTQVTLKNVSVYNAADRITHYGGHNSEVKFIVYQHHTNLGPEFQGQNEHFDLYHGKTPVYFSRIEFGPDGEAQLIQFKNHDDLSSKSVTITFPGKEPDYTGDEWYFSGQPIDGAGEDSVNIRGSKIKVIVFDGVPPQYPYDKQ